VILDFGWGGTAFIFTYKKALTGAVTPGLLEK